MITYCSCQGADVHNTRGVLAKLLLGGQPAQVPANDLGRILAGKIRGDAGWLRQATGRGRGLRHCDDSNVHSSVDVFVAETCVLLPGFAVVQRRLNS